MLFLEFPQKQRTLFYVKIFRRSPRPPTAQGFSILELLVVVAIIALLSTLAVAGLGAVGASRISTAALELRSAAELARQRAMTSGKPVELRLYKPTGSTGDYSAFRIVKIDGTNETRLKLSRLPDGISMRSLSAGSSILASAPVTNEEVPGFIAAETRRIRYLPNGSIEGLSSSAPQTISIAKAAEPAVANGLPANFATVSFDAILGTTAIFRP